VAYVFRPTILSMRQIPAPRNNTAVMVQAEGSAGMYVFDAADTGLPNNTTTFSATDGTVGLWKQRLVAGTGSGSGGYTNIDQVIADLSGRITTTQLSASLNTRINLIDAASAVTGSVAWYAAQEQSARAAAVAALAADLDAVNASLTGDIATVDGRVDGVAGDMATFNGELAGLSAQVADLAATPEFDTNDDYVIGNIVKWNGGLYQAIANMTAPSPLPSATGSWTKIGDYDSLGQAVIDLSGQVTNLDGEVTLVKGRATALETSVNNPTTGLSSRALTTTLNSQIAGVYGAAVTEFSQISARFTSVEADVDSKASSTDLTTAISNVYGAAVSSFTNIEAAFTSLQSDVDAKAGVTETNAAIAAAEDAAVATATTQVYTSLGGNQAAVEAKASSWDGTTAQWSVKTDVNDLVGGIGLFNDGVTTRAMVVADEFAVWDGTDPVVPFIIDSGNVYINSAFINELSVNKLAAGTLGIQINMGAEGRIVYDNGSYIKAEGLGFGTSNQFLEWFGPRPTGGNLALCSEANAIRYLKTNGDAYFGGSLAAGVLTNGAQSTSLAAPPIDLTVGPFGSNGGTIQVVASINIADQGVSAVPVSGSPTATLELYRRLATGSETLVRTQQFVGTRTFEDNSGEPGLDSYVNENIGGSFTYTDPTLSTQTRTYRVRLSQRGLWALAPPNIQVMGLTATEV
jgi:hypothetical protein